MLYGPPTAKTAQGAPMNKNIDFNPGMRFARSAKRALVRPITEANKLIREVLVMETLGVHVGGLLLRVTAVQ
jgi:hypothetical protein